MNEPIRVDGFVLTPPHAYPYRVLTDPHDAGAVARLVHMAFRHAIAWPSAN